MRRQEHDGVCVLNRVIPFDYAKWVVWWIEHRQIRTRRARLFTLRVMTALICCFWFSILRLSRQNLCF